MSLTAFKAKYGNTIYEVSNNPEIRNIIQNCITSKMTMYSSVCSVEWNNGKLK